MTLQEHTAPVTLTGALTPPLSELVHNLDDLKRRRRAYAKLEQRRDLIEPTVNAFELRRETCPDRVAGPLNGLPITVKDQVAVAGWPRSFGLEKLSKRPDTTSAPLVARLVELGAVVTGKTALPPYAMDFQTGNARRGPTCNPHNPLFTAGGSTGGGAAAVASGMSPLDVGADLAGSLRIPAAWCGVCSYVPSEGFWPNYGLLKGAHCLDHFARIGLTAARVRDLGYVLDLLEPDAAASGPPTGKPRIALWEPGAAPPCAAETHAAWQTLTQTLTDRGNFDISQDAMHTLFDASVRKLGGEMIGHMTGALLPAFVRWLMRRDRRATQLSPGFIRHVHTGYRRDPQRYSDNCESLAALRAEADRLWKDRDALLLPVTGICAFKHIAPIRDQSGVRTYDTVFDTKAGPKGYYDALTYFTLPVTVLGWPAVTLPIGRDVNGVPIGAQLIGKPGTDGALLALAVRLQAAFM
ncbi:MAG: amidase [Pseudomonadota bacterium]